jgi:hypothetical protein
MKRAGNEKLSWKNISIPVAANTVITEGTMVAINADGFAVMASKKTGQTVAGCATRIVDNTSGENGDVSVPVRRGTFVWNNDGTIEETDILKDAYVSDGQTVTITSEGSSRAGKILAVDTDGVTVEML